jgi:hypothetical protein
VADQVIFVRSFRGTIHIVSVATGKMLCGAFPLWQKTDLFEETEDAPTCRTCLRVFELGDYCPLVGRLNQAGI